MYLQLDHDVCCHSASQAFDILIQMKESPMHVRLNHTNIPFQGMYGHLMLLNTLMLNINYNIGVSLSLCEQIFQTVNNSDKVCTNILYVFSVTIHLWVFLDDEKSVSRL